MNVRWLVVAGFLCAGAGTASWAEPGSETSQLATLREQRRDVLHERVNVMEANYRSGQVSFEQMIAARNDLLESELALATTQARRVELLEQRLQNFRQLEELMERRASAGMAEMPDQLLAKSERLKAEIDLLTAQQTPEKP